MPEQLADLVRQNYPGKYDDLDDQTLEDNILKKYPQYSDLTGPNRNAPPAALKVDNPDVDQRIKEAKDFLAKPSVPEEGLNPDGSPKYKTPETPRKSTLESAADSIGEFVTKHPRLQEALTGTSPEFERMKKEQGITDVQGPGFMRIPGLSEENIRKAAEYITGSEGTGRLAAGAITKALGDIAATGFDPRAMGAPRAGRAISEAAGGPVIFDFPDAIDITPGGAETPVREPVRTPIAKIGGEVAEPSNLPVRRSTEIPYRAPEDSFTAGATETQDVAPPIVPERGMEQPENLVPAPAKEPTPGMTEDQLFQQAVEKFNMGRPLPEQPQQEDLPVREPINQAITARHIGTQPGYQDIPEQDLFNVEGGPEHGSTLTRQGLEDRGIPVPERNPELAGKTGDQLRAEALAKRKLPFDNPFERAPEQTDIEPSFSRNFGKPQRFSAPNIQQDMDIIRQLRQEAETDPRIADILDSEDNESLNAELRKRRILYNFNPSDEEPSFARSEKGGIKTGVNIKRHAEAVTTGYSGPLEGIMVREGMQNAIDAVRKLGHEGNIDAEVTKKGFTIRDNGKGMNRKELETVFSDLDETGKLTDAGATGGKGIGKASYQRGGKIFKAETVVFENGKKIKRTIEATPDMWDVHVPITEEEVPFNTPTGTKISTEFGEGQAHYNAIRMLDKIHEFSRGVQANLNKSVYENMTSDKFHTGEGDMSIGETKVEGNKISVILPKEDNDLESRHSINLHILNNGMYQYSDYMYLGGEAVDNMPNDILVNVRPTAEEGTTEYPFLPSRESMKNEVDKKIRDFVKDKLVNPEINRKKFKLNEIYQAMIELPARGVRDTVMFDPGNRLHPDELNYFKGSKVINEFVSTIDALIQHALAEVGNETWTNRLERVGLVLDDGMHGVHIPNPETGKSAILLNPFMYLARMTPKDASLENVITGLHEIAHIGVEQSGHEGNINYDEVDDPRIGRYLQAYLHQVMTHGGLDISHDLAFVKRLGEVFAEFGPKRTFQYADKLERIFTDQSGELSPETENLLQIYQRSRRRDATTEDLLVPTGAKQPANRGGKGNISSDSSGSGGGTPTQSAVRKLLAALEEAHSANDEQAASIRQERAKRFAEFEGVKAKGRKGAAQSLSKLRGEYEKEDFTSTLGDSLKEKDVDALFTAVKIANITPAEKARGYTALFKLLNGVLPPRSDLKVLGDVFGSGFSNRVVEMHGGLGGVPIKLTKVANSMKALRSSLDISAPLRQGLGLIHRGEWWSALGDAFTFLANKDAYEYAMHMIQKDPYYLVGREAGLFLAKPDDMIEGEETFMNSYVHNIPKWTGIPKLVDASERAYTGFLNELRFRTFKNLVQLAKEAGHETFTLEKAAEDAPIHIATTKLTDDIAKMINISTGRGSLGRFEKIAAEINAVIWSPKFLSSRLTMLNPKYYHDLDKFARWEAIKSLFAIAGFGIGVTSIGALMGGKSLGNPLSGYLQSDPHQFGNMNWLSGQNPQILSTDFAKTRFGQNVVDPWGGFQQPIVATARLITGEANGRPQARTTTLGNFAVNKLSPMAALAFEIGSAKQFTGKGQFVDAYGQKKYLPAEIANSFVPMFVQDVRDVYQTDAPFFEKVGLDTASLFGMGIQQYPEANTQKSKLKFRKMTLSR